MKIMFRLRGFKNFLLIFGFLALFVTGYTATSVVTSCPAQAVLPMWCCGPMPCMMPGTLSVEIVLILVRTIVPGILFIVGSVSLYYGIVVARVAFEVVQQVSMTLNDWWSFWDTMWFYNLAPAMQDFTDQLNMMSADQTRSVGAFLDATDRNREQKLKQAKDAEEHRTHTPSESVCVSGTVMGGNVQAASFSRAYNATAPVDMYQRTTAHNPSNPHSAGGVPGQDLALRHDFYGDNYCHPLENQSQNICSDDVTPAQYAARDVDVTGQIFERETIIVTDPLQKRVVDDLIANVSEPMIPAPVPVDALEASQGVDSFLQLESLKTKRQIIYDALYFPVSQRIPGSGTGKFLQHLRQEAGSTDPYIFTDEYNPSFHEVLHVMGKERYWTNFNTRFQIAEPENSKQEVVVQTGIQMMDMNRMNEIWERYALLLAARVSDNINRHYPPETSYSQVPTQ